MVAKEVEPKETKETKPQVRSIEETVKSLRDETANNKTLNAICHIFSLRERARSQITVASLRQTMVKEGFSFSLQEYEKALRFMASIGIGKLHFDRSGKIHALKDIKLTLQSIGLAAVANHDTLESFSHQKKFTNIPAVVHPRQTVNLKPRQIVEIRDTAGEKSIGVTHEAGYSATIIVEIEGKPVQFPLPRKITTRELGEILSLELSKR